MTTHYTRARLGALLLAGALSVTAGTLQTPSPATAAPAPPSPKTKTVPVGGNPYDVAISQRLGQAFVVNDGSVTILSLTTHRVLDTVGTNGYHGQDGIALASRETRVYITNYDSPNLVILDTETRRLLTPLNVGTGAVDVAAINTAAGQLGYVAYNHRKQLTGITTSTSTRPAKISQHVQLPQPAQTLAAAPDNTHIWAGSVNDGHIFVIDTRAGKVTTTIDVEAVGPVVSIAFSPNGKQFWVAGLGGLGVYDTTSHKNLKFWSTPSLFTRRYPNIGEVALTGTGRYAYVENSTSPDAPTRGEIAMIDTTTYRIIHHIPTGKEPIALKIDTHRNTAYVPNYTDSTLTYFPTQK